MQVLTVRAFVTVKRFNLQPLNLSAMPATVRKMQNDLDAPEIFSLYEIYLNVQPLHPLLPSHPIAKSLLERDLIERHGEYWRTTKRGDVVLKKIGIAARSLNLSTILED